MNIKEAIDLALPQGAAITREGWDTDILPTNTVEGMIIMGHRYYKAPSDRLFPAWQPSAMELAADDWKVVKVIDPMIPATEIDEDFFN